MVNNKRRTWLLLFIATTVFIGAILISAIYADRQIVDYRVVKNDAKSLGIDSISLERTFVRYDSDHYRNIVNYGYDDPTRTAFFPLYPLSAYGLTMIGIPAGLALQLISTLFTIASAYILYRWLNFEIRDHDFKISPWQVLLIIGLFPTSLYLTIGYSESLFIFLTTSSLYAYRTNRFWLAGVCIALATATRVQGGALAVFFLLDYLSRHSWRFKLDKRIISILVAPIGLGAYMFYLNFIYGNPFQFIEAQQAWGRLSGNIIENLVNSFTPPYLWYVPVLAIMLYATKRYLGWIWFWYCLLFILIPVLSGRIDSLNRYILALPPLFLALAVWLETKPVWLRGFYLISSSMLLMWNIVFFFNGYWVG